jgi:hypothetical protein
MNYKGVTSRWYRETASSVMYMLAPLYISILHKQVHRNTSNFPIPSNSHPQYVLLGWPLTVCQCCQRLEVRLGDECKGSHTPRSKYQPRAL